MWLLTDKEKEFLSKQGYILLKNIFNDDICSDVPHRKGYYVGAVHKLARLLGYRDGWDRSFQRGRKAFQKVYEQRM